MKSFFLSILFFATLSHAQTSTTVSNDQMMVAGDYILINGAVLPESPYLINVMLKRPSDLKSVTKLQAPEILVPSHRKVYLKIDGDASVHEESYSFFKFSKKNWSQNEIFSPFMGTDDFDEFSIAGSQDAPNIKDIIDGDSYAEEISSLPNFAEIPVFGCWFDNLKDYQLQIVPLIRYWNANEEGTVNLHLEGTIGYDKKESLFFYRGWKWSPKRDKEGEAIVVTLDLPITIVNEQDQKQSQDPSNSPEAAVKPLQD